MILRFALTLFLTTLPGFASALPVDWQETLSVSADAGPENPLVLFGFNPQPEPPALVINNDLDPTAALREVLGVEPTPFNLFLAADGGSFTSGLMPVLSLGTPGLLGFDVGFITDLGTDLTFELRFFQNGSQSLIEADALFFNPQPEPPALWGVGGLGVQIEFANLISGDNVGAGLQIRDGAGTALALTSGPAVIPVPAPVWLMLGGFGLLGASQLRGRG